MMVVLPVKEAIMPGKILPCNCVHEAQDRFHGKGNRVHTARAGNEKFRCTVCSTERTATEALALKKGAPPAPPKKKKRKK